MQTFELELLDDRVISIDWLLNKGITMIGSIMLDKSAIPQELKSIQSRQVLTVETFWHSEENKVLTRYVVKTSKGLKNVMVLSSVESILGVTKDDGKNKAAIFKLYDFTKGIIDIIDQKMGSYTVKKKSRKWTKVAFAYLLNTVRVNANTLLNLNKPETNCWHFGKNSLVFVLTLRFSHRHDF